MMSAGTDGSKEADIGVYIINAGRFDQQSGVYTVDFYLSMICPQNCSGDFEFTNGRASSTDKIPSFYLKIIHY